MFRNLNASIRAVIDCVSDFLLPPQVTRGVYRDVNEDEPELFEFATGRNSKRAPFLFGSSVREDAKVRGRRRERRFGAGGQML